MPSKPTAIRQKRSRSLGDGRATSPHPIHGSFRTVSPSRVRSLSPHKRLPRRIPKQSVHINMNLTEYQMDRLTDAFSNQSMSPQSKNVGSNGVAAQSIPRMKSPNHKNKLSESMPTRSRGRLVPEFENGPIDTGEAEVGYDAHNLRDAKCASVSTTFSDLMPRYTGKPAPMPKSIAERRNQIVPQQIETGGAAKEGGFIHGQNASSSATRPMTPEQVLHSPADGYSSFYSQDERFSSPEASPMRGPHGAVSDRIDDMLQTCTGWRSPHDAENFASTAQQSPTRSQSPVRGGSPRRSGSPARTGQRLQPPIARGSRVLNLAGQPVSRTGMLRQPQSDNGGYSPLTTYFAFEGLPVQRIGGKTLIGEQGWLERPLDENSKQTSDHKKGERSPKKFGILDSLKKMAKDMTDTKAQRRPREANKEPRSPRLSISLDPREQSLLYCELESHVSNALHVYINNELSHGRLDPNKLKKIADGWCQKGRPKIVGFRYDLETQLELIYLHLGDFRFFGRRQGNPLEISGLLHAMKINARAMRIRTFCQPDSVIAKQLVDSQSLFNTIGCSEMQQIALAEIAQFFKVIVERERTYRDNIVRQEERRQPQQQQQPHPGRKWEPAAGYISDSNEIFGSALTDNDVNDDAEGPSGPWASSARY